MLLPKDLDLSCDFGGYLNPGLALRPLHFRNGLDEPAGGKDFVRVGFHNGFPFHVHVVDDASLAGPVTVFVRLGSKMANADDAGMLLIADTDEDEAVTFVGLLMLNDAPVEAIGRTIPFIFVGEDFLALPEVEIVQETVQFIAGKEGVPVEEKGFHLGRIIGYLYRSIAAW